MFDPILLPVRDGLEVPLTDDDGADLVSEDYVRFVISKANRKMKENLQKIEKFERDLKCEFSARQPPVDVLPDRKEVYRRKNKPVRDKTDRLEQFETDVLDNFNFPG